MTFLEAAVSAAQHLFTLPPLLGMLIVLPIALIAGMIPGGGLTLTVIVFSMVGFLPMWVAVTIVIFQASASEITEPIWSILMGIPGARSAQATVLDGYPMSRRGLGGVALGASYMSTLTGGLIGAMALLISLPFARSLLFYFGSPEFFLLSLIGILSVAVVSAGAVAKGLLTGALGLAISTIGYSPVAQVVRTDFGLDYLYQGIPLIPIVVGLFALPEVINLVVGNNSIATERLDGMLKDSRKDILRGMRTALNHKLLIFRSALVGTFVGMVPGLGGSVAHWIAYAQARQTERGAKKTFGTGDVRGVIAAEAANNSSDGAVLIPTLAFGIPGSGRCAIVLAMLILYGLNPGPEMLSKNLDFTISMVYTIVIANIVVVPIVLAFGRWIIRLSIIPPNALAPIIIAIVTISAFQGSQEMGDLVTVLAFAVLGTFMKRYGWPRPPILISVVLGHLLEQYLWLSTQTYGFGMFTRPMFLGIVGVVAVLLLWSVKRRKRADEAEENIMAHLHQSDQAPVMANVPRE
jgi:TctA family transporter